MKVNIDKTTLHGKELCKCKIYRQKMFNIYFASSSPEKMTYCIKTPPPPLPNLPLNCEQNTIYDLTTTSDFSSEMSLKFPLHQVSQELHFFLSWKFSEKNQS